MHLDPLMLKLVAALLVILAVGLASRILKQPHVVGYLLAGVILGPYGLGMMSDQHAVARLGEFGVMFLLFRMVHVVMVVVVVVSLTHSCSCCCCCCSCC